MSKLELKENPTLADYQEYIRQMVVERGFDNESAPQIFMMMTEEVGEVAKAIRKLEGLQSNSKTRQVDLSHEMADVLIYLLDLANVLGVDLEKAFREKEEINKKRNWN